MAGSCVILRLIDVEKEHLSVSAVRVVQHDTAEAIEANGSVIKHEGQVVDEFRMRLEPVSPSASGIHQRGTS